MPSFPAVHRSAIAAAPGFWANRRGSVGIIFALSAVPILFGFGMGLDYASAARRHERMNAIADAAALSATTPAMMQQTSAQAQVAATAMFLAQAGQVGGLSNTSVTITVDDSPTKGTVVRTIKVTYASSSANNFSKLLAMNTIPLSGNSAASTAIPPNTNFYLLLDSSPSMAIAATPADIQTMLKNTPKQEKGNGCAFACHQTNPGVDNLGNPNGEDNYALARALGVTLRIDLVNQAAQDLMTFLNQQSGTYHTKYASAVYSFDASLTKLGDMTDVTISATQAKANASNLQMLTVYSNNYLTKTNANFDQDTVWDASMNTMNSNMPTPGNGTNNGGDTPQEVLLIVTDGVIDQSNNGRQYGAMGGPICTTIKNRGIRIAILYTTYNPLPTDGWYNAHVAPFQSTIGSTLQTCATPGLYNVVDTGGDISSALRTLTSKALLSSHLVQ